MWLRKDMKVKNIRGNEMTIIGKNDASNELVGSCLILFSIKKIFCIIL